jgi:CheY-like chemotaxis protein
LKSLPIILMTPSNLTELQPMAGLNLQAHLLKPVRSSLLLSTVCRVVASNQDQQTTKLVADLRGQLQVGALKTEDLPLEILIAEDNEINIQLYTQILTLMKCRFRIVKDGVQAVDIWRKDRPLVVLMDVNMPVMDGFDATRAIRIDEENSGLVRTPIIGVTTHTSDEDRRACLDVGMDDYLPKPINPDRLAEKLESWLGIARDNDAGDRSAFNQSA